MLGPGQRLRLRQEFPSVLRARNLAVVLLIATATAGCAPESAPAPRVVRVWCQQGQEGENQAMRAMAAFQIIFDGIFDGKGHAAKTG